MAGLFALTTFLAAFLLFVIEPISAKSVLPTLGGAPSVWNTSLMFFQAAVLAGYAYAHLSADRFGGKAGRWVHIALLALAALTFPIVLVPGDPGPAAIEAPVSWLLLRLVVGIGGPFVVISATSPLLQTWYSRSDLRGASNPYPLYAASNFGSMAALLGYPFLIEPYLSLGAQLNAWAVAYLVLAVMVGACGLLTRIQPHPGPDLATDEPAGSTRVAASWPRWMLLSALPSSLMMGATTYLTTDLAPVPLLWVVPLALYLLTFIAVFQRDPSIDWTRLAARTYPAFLIILLPILAIPLVKPYLLIIHLLALTVGSLLSHGLLASEKPHPRQLTSYYLAMSVGGLLGGVFNALVAPVIFGGFAEYPLVLAAIGLLVPAVATRKGKMQGGWPADLWIPACVGGITLVLVRNPGAAGNGLGPLGAVLASGLAFWSIWTLRSRPRRLALTIGAVWLASSFAVGLNGRTVFQERNFFGVIRVTEVDQPVPLRRLFHGSTLHGQQRLDAGHRDEPLAYFRRGGPIWRVVDRVQTTTPKARIGIVGLGVGTLASQAKAGEVWTFFEIDPAIARIAGDPKLFTYLSDSKASATPIVLGDARLRLKEAESSRFDLLVLDAFSSDALPVHLITREALALYLERLAPNGLLAFNITNRYLDLEPVLGELAADAGIVGRVVQDLDLTPEQMKTGLQPSLWFVAARRDADMGPLADAPGWTVPRRREDGQVWTDDDSNIASAFVLGVPRNR